MKQTLVVKIGTSSLTQPSRQQLSLATLGAVVETLTRLRQLGHRVVLVSSGAVGVGCSRLGLCERPTKIGLRQAVAAVGQGRLIRVYDDLFSSLQQPIAQVLLTRREVMERNAYLNAYNTLSALLDLEVIPIINENDTVAVEELKFGDNDTLSALVASVLEADWLFLLTDVDRLYSADPRLVPHAEPITLVESRELAQLRQQVQAGHSRNSWGTGGMVTKLEAAQIATTAGVRTVIMHGNTPGNIERILAGESLGTQFAPQPKPENARKRWIAYGLVPEGVLYLDAGAVQAVGGDRKSLLAAGICRVEGEFESSVAVELQTSEGHVLGRGIVNYSSDEIRKIKGYQSTEIPRILGYAGVATVIHRDNLVLQSWPEANR